MPTNGEKGLYEGIVYADEDGRSSLEDSEGSSRENEKVGEHVGRSEGGNEEVEGEKKRHVLRKLRH
jgi:hypothetical protein